MVTESGAEQFGYVSTAGSYASASDKRVYFGLGKESKVRLIEIAWPSGTVQRIQNVPADDILKIREPE